MKGILDFKIIESNFISKILSVLYHSQLANNWAYQISIETSPEKIVSLSLLLISFNDKNCLI